MPALGQFKRSLTGQQFGEWIAGARGQNPQSGQARWLCRCSCGTERWVYELPLVQGKTISCGCRTGQNIVKARAQERALIRETNSRTVSKKYWTNLRNNALARQIEMTITREDAQTLFDEQGAKCALSGLPIALAETANDGGTASLDRRDSSKGYALGNVQWVHRDVNCMKWDFDESYFIQLCTAVAQKAALITDP